MDKQTLCEVLKKGFLYLDGATGSNLQKAGMPNGVCPEAWILQNPDVLQKLQREYIEAGSQILYASTFTCNRIKLKEYGLEAEIESMNQRLVALSKAVAGNNAYVAGDLTMTGRQLAPMGSLTFEELVEVYKEQAQILYQAGVDLLVVETMMSLQETRAAVLAINEVCDLPILVTMTFEENGRALFGTDARTAAVVMEALGVFAVGINCSVGPDKMAEMIAAMKEVTTIPIIAKPNAGMPVLKQDGSTAYEMDAVTFGSDMQKLIDAGAVILGGCCGTTSEHIRELKKQTQLREPICQKEDEPKESKRYLTSERMSIGFGLSDNFIIVGERINPTGKKALQAQLREGNLDMVMQFAQEQEACGAKILDINMGMSGIDEKEMMLKVIEEVTQMVSLPIAIDSSHIEVVEAALRLYPGRALINSISLEEGKTEALLPLAKKYGAMFILLPLSEQGLPKDLAEKKEIIHTIMDKALAIGLKKEDIIVDGLVTTVGANPNASIETLETIAYCKQLGLATVCGLSNISFGLPERGCVNTAFLTLAIQAGLTMAIANPSQKPLVQAALAADLLMNKKEAANVYIEGIQAQNEQETGQKVMRENAAREEINIADLITEAVRKGKKSQIVELVTKAINQGKKPAQILDESLLPAINQVGELFDKGIYFLPQLIASAEAMKRAVEYIEPMLLEQGDKKEVGTVVIASVKGDIHDIGKNLVVLMLKNYGFRVVDLGKDIPKEDIIQAAKDEKADIIALSALMTTTMQEMREVIMHAKAEKLAVKIMIGGAVITEDYAKEIEADGYSKDAAGAVRLAKSLLA